jgi:hypothetical protein
MFLNLRLNFSVLLRVTMIRKEPLHLLVEGIWRDPESQHVESSEFESWRDPWETAGLVRRVWELWQMTVIRWDIFHVFILYKCLIIYCMKHFQCLQHWAPFGNRPLPYKTCCVKFALLNLISWHLLCLSYITEELNITCYTEIIILAFCIEPTEPAILSPPAPTAYLLF